MSGMCVLRPVQGLVEELKKLGAGEESATTMPVDKAMTICFRAQDMSPRRHISPWTTASETPPLFAGSGGGAEKAEGG